MKIAFKAFLTGAFCFLAEMGICAPSPGLQSVWNVVDHVPLEKVIIQSHRGAGFLTEENTLEAFEVSWRMGVIPEADVRTTKDGVIVPFHDKTFKRLVKEASEELKKQGPQDVSYEFLSTLDVGSWKGDAFKGRRVPTMMQVFKAMRGHPERKLYLDLKDVDLARLAAEVKVAGVEKQVILASRYPHIHKEWSGFFSETQGLLWMPGNEAEVTEIIDALEKEKFPGITQVQLHVRKNKDDKSAGPYRHTRAFILNLGERLRANGLVYQTLPWGGEDSVYFDLLDLGVESFATDTPDMVLDVLKKYYQLHKSGK